MPSLQSIVDRQIQRWNLEMKMRRERGGKGLGPRPVITVSRTLGSGGGEVARLVAQRMNLQLYEKEILEQIAARGDVRQELVAAIDEHTRSRLESWVDGMLRRRIFDEGDYYHHLVEILIPLVELGSVVIVGRGANYVLHDRLTLDVRIVAPVAVRVARLMDTLRIGREAAEAEIQRSDADRALFIRRVFNRDWDDPLGYDLVLNTEDLALEAAAALIESAWAQLALTHKEQSEPDR